VPESLAKTLPAGAQLSGITGNRCPAWMGTGVRDRAHSVSGVNRSTQHFRAGAGDYAWVHTDSVAPGTGARPDGRGSHQSRRIARHARRDVLRTRRDLGAPMLSPPKHGARGRRVRGPADG